MASSRTTVVHVLPHISRARRSNSPCGNKNVIVVRDTNGYESKALSYTMSSSSPADAEIHRGKTGVLLRPGSSVRVPLSRSSVLVLQLLLSAGSIFDLRRSRSHSLGNFARLLQIPPDSVEVLYSPIWHVKVVG